MERSELLQRLIEAGEVTVPEESGIPDLVLGLAPAVDSVADMLIAERDDERGT